MAHLVKVPENLILEAMIISNPPTSFKVTKRNIEILYYYCSVLVELRIKHGGYNESHNGFTPLHSRYLKMIHESYIDYLNYLIAIGVLDTDSIYIQGEKSKGYRFNSSYTGVPLKIVELTDYILRKAIKKQMAGRTEVKRKSLRKYTHILKWFLDGNLEIDTDAALIWINKQYTQELMELLYSDSSEKQSKSKILHDVWQASVHFVDRLSKGSFRLEDFSSDNFGRRLHGMFTYQRCELRNFITYEGYQLVSIDIKNSQPYFSTLLLDGEFWKSKKTNTQRIKLSEINEEIYRRIRQDNRIYEGIKWLDSSRSLTRQRISGCRYREDAVSGRLYENFETKLREQLPNSFMEKHMHRVVGRDGVKKEVLRTLYSKNSMLDRDFYLPSRIFHSTYPDAMRFFRILKHGNHKLIAEIIQQVESYCVLKLICGKIAKERPHVPIFTIHDSVISTKGNEEYVKNVIEEVLASKIGSAPEVRLEEWKIENLT